MLNYTASLSATLGVIKTTEDWTSGRMEPRTKQVEKQIIASEIRLAISEANCTIMTAN